MLFAEAAAQAIDGVLHQPASRYAPAAQRVVRLVHEAEVARRAGHRPAPPFGEPDGEVRLAEERPRPGNEVGVAALDDPLHRRGPAHPSHEDDRLRDTALELPRRPE